MSARRYDHVGPAVPAGQAERSSAGLKRIAAILLAIVREIFDEAAYARFLQRNGKPASRASYAAFLRETQLARATRPRCC